MTRKRMTVQIPARIPEEDAKALDEAVARGAFESRSDAIRQAVDMLLKELREQEIVEAYRRGYGKYPQEEWVGQVGLALFAARVAAEEDKRPL